MAHQQRGCDLRESRWHDYIWMYLLAFAFGAFIFWFGVLFFFKSGGYMGTVRNSRYRTEVAAPTPEDARRAMLKLTLIGGTLGMGTLALWQFGSKRAEKESANKISRNTEVVWRRNDS